jgi:hypothetical protein
LRHAAIHSLPSHHLLDSAIFFRRGRLEARQTGSAERPYYYHQPHTRRLIRDSAGSRDGCGERYHRVPRVGPLINITRRYSATGQGARIPEHPERLGWQGRGAQHSSPREETRPNGDTQASKDDGTPVPIKEDEQEIEAPPSRTVLTLYRSAPPKQLFSSLQQPHRLSPIDGISTHRYGRQGDSVIARDKPDEPHHYDRGISSCRARHQGEEGCDCRRDLSATRSLATAQSARTNSTDNKQGQQQHHFRASRSLDLRRPNPMRIKTSRPTSGWAMAGWTCQRTRPRPQQSRRVDNER